MNTGTKKMSVFSRAEQIESKLSHQQSEATPADTYAAKMEREAKSR